MKTLFFLYSDLCFLLVQLELESQCMWRRSWWMIWIKTATSHSSWISLLALAPTKLRSAINDHNHEMYFTEKKLSFLKCLTLTYCVSVESPRISSCPGWTKEERECLGLQWERSVSFSLMTWTCQHWSSLVHNLQLSFCANSLTIRTGITH